MNLLPVESVKTRILNAIIERNVLSVRYQHVSDGQIVDHLIAPFDIGTTNPSRAAVSDDLVWAFCFTHIDPKTLRPDPRVLSLDAKQFVAIGDTGDDFDENELAEIHRNRTGYDYRNCRFAKVPERDWFKSR